MDTVEKKLRSGPSSETSKGPEKGPKTTGKKEVQEKASQVLESAEGAESVESGRVSESASEDKAVGPQSAGGKAQYSSDEIEAIRAKLLKAIPPQAVMVKQIRQTLVKQEKALTRKMKKLQKKSHLHAFELTKVVAQLRKVREYFSTLAHATYELVKHLWLKIVHGV